MKTIEVMLASYNGEKYIAEQLDSILGQDIEEKGIASLHLTVRDDGSTDNTVSIVEEYALKYPDKIKLIKGANVGVIRGFFTMLKAAPDVDYYAFADQDDWWLSDKLSVAVGFINGSDGPALYSSATKLVDSKLNAIESGIDRSNVRPSFNNAVLENVATGCTCVFNASLRDLVVHKLPVHVYMHDWWLYLVATAFGEYYYDETPHILYRQHEGNVLGNDSGRLGELVNRLKRFKKSKNKLSRQLKDFVVIFKDRFPEDECVKLAREMVVAKKSIFKRIKLLKSSGIDRHRKGDDSIFKLLIFLGIY